MRSGIITGLFVYPIKSCAAVPVSESLCLPSGLENDRCWGIVDSNGKLLTQRDDPRLALIQPQIKDNRLVLSADTRSPVEVTESRATGTLLVSKWGEQVVCTDEGDAAAEWLAALLAYECRLVRVDTKTEPTDSVMFNDCAPLLVMFEETLEDVNSRLEDPVEMDRFRPSVVIRGFDQYAENEHSCLSTNVTSLLARKPCGRCVIINIDQSRAIRHLSEPLRTLSEYRSVNEKVVLGHYFAADRVGKLCVGMSVHS